MDENNLVKFIADARQQGMEDNVIKQKLLSKGWDEGKVSAHLQPSIDIPVPSPASSSERVISHESMWDTFESILLFISLYVMSISIGVILNTFIDKWVPDITNSYSYSLASTLYGHILLWSIAALIVSTPLYIFFFLRITKRTLENPNVRKVKSRKTMMYLTMVVTFIILLTNLIGIIFNFLSGSFALNTLLHFFVTIGISTVIFLYYLKETSDDRRIYAEK